MRERRFLLSQVFLSILMVLDTTLFDKECQWLETGRWFSPGSPISSTDKTDRHDNHLCFVKRWAGIFIQWLSALEQFHLSTYSCQIYTISLFLRISRLSLKMSDIWLLFFCGEISEFWALLSVWGLTKCILLWIMTIYLQNLSFRISEYLNSNVGKYPGRFSDLLDLQLPMQSVPITTDVVSLNLDQGEVYNIMCFSNLYLIFIDIKINSSCEGETDIIASIILRVWSW
jgi:hypothetical protein